MPKIAIAGNAIVVTSELKLSDLRTVKKYRPEALELKGGRFGIDTVFAISTEGTPGINEFGATFRDESRDGSGKACITLDLPENSGDPKAFVADKYGSALINIGKLEETLPDVIEDVCRQRESVLEQIAIV